MMATISRVRHDTLFKLQKDDCKSLAKFYRRADKIMHLDTAQETIQARKPVLAEKNNDNGKKQKNEDRCPSLEKMNKKPNAPDQKVARPPPSEFTNYTDLISLQEDVLMAAE